MSREGNRDAIAELCTQFERLNATRKIRELDYLVVFGFGGFGAKSLEKQALGEQGKLLDKNP